MPLHQLAARHAAALGAFFMGVIVTYLSVGTGLIVPDNHQHPATNHHVYAPSFQELFDAVYDSCKPTDVASNAPLLPTISVVIEDAISVYPIHNESKIRTMLMYTDEGDPIGVNITNVKLETLVITDEMKELEQATLQQLKRQILGRFVEKWRRELQDMVEKHSTTPIILKFMYELTVWAIAELLLKFDLRHHVIEMYGLMRAWPRSRHLPTADREALASTETDSTPTKLQESLHDEDDGTLQQASIQLLQRRIAMKGRQLANAEKLVDEIDSNLERLVAQVKKDSTARDLKVKDPVFQPDEEPESIIRSMLQYTSMPFSQETPAKDDTVICRGPSQELKSPASSVWHTSAKLKPESDNVKPEPNSIASESDNVKPKPDNDGFFSGPCASSPVSQDVSPVHSPTSPDSPISRKSATSIPGSHGSASFLASSPSSPKLSEPLLTPEAPIPKFESSDDTPLSGQNLPSTSEPTTSKQIQPPTEDAASIDTLNGEQHMPQGRAAPTISAPKSGASKPAFQVPRIIPAVPRLPHFRPSPSTKSQPPTSTSDAPKLTAPVVLTPPARSEDSVRPVDGTSKTGEAGPSPPTSGSSLAGGASSRQVSSSLPAKTQLPQRSAQADAAFQATVAQLNPDGEVVKAGSGGMMSNADLYEAAAARKASVPAAFPQSTSTEVSSKPSKRAPKYEAQPYKRPAHPTSVFPKDTEPVQGYRQSNDRRGFVARPCVADRSCMNPDCVGAHRGPRVSAFSPFTMKQWCTFDEQCDRPNCYRWHRAPKRSTDWATFGGGRR